MEIRWLPRTSRRKTKPASPRGWKYSALIGSRVPQSRAHVWRLGPGNRELERVLGDLQARGATILGHEPGEVSSITAECGLTSLLGYATQLRSQTKGRGQFTMEFDRFDVL